MTARGTSPTTDAAAALTWLRAVGAIRHAGEVAEGGRFIVELADRRVVELDAAEVPAFRTGVLVGWRLVRTRGPEAVRS